MRIGIYNPRVGITSAGGTETFLREVMKRLQHNHEITLYCGAGSIVPQVDNLSVEVREIPFAQKESRLNKLLCRSTPLLPAEIESLSMYANAKLRGVFEDISDSLDVLSTHYYLDNVLVSRSVTVPTLFRFPGIKQPSPRWKAMAKLAKPDTYLANSQATATRVQDWLRLNMDGTVYAGVDEEQFTSDVDPAFDDDRIVVLFVGRIDEGKGLDELIEAQSRIGETTRLYIVGSGTIESELRAKVTEHSIEDSVRFVGSVPHDEIQRYYAAADVFCLPSHHESLGIVNLEAMAAGLPVVTTRIDAIEEYVTHNKNGMLVPPGDADALTDSLRQLAFDSGLRFRLATAAQTTASRFSWGSQAEKMESFYEATSGR